MEGEEMRAHAMLRRRFSPPDMPRTRMPPGSAPPTCAPAFNLTQLLAPKLNARLQQGSLLATD